MQQRQRLEYAADALSPARLIVVHPGSGGSAVNLTVDQYAALIGGVDRQLSDSTACWLISAGPGEEAAAQALIDQLKSDGIVAHRLPASASVAEFAQQLAGADMLIAGSTGPLHIAGCLNIATAGFYPAKRSATPLRWQTCNSAEKRMAFSPPASADQQDMAAIDIETAAKQVSALLNG